MDIKKHTILVIMSLFVIFLIGCTKPTTNENNLPAINEIKSDGQQQNQNPVIVQPDPNLADKVKEVFEECDLDQDPAKIEDIDISMFHDGLEKNENGIVFDFMALDNDGNILPVNGVLSVKLFSTKLFNGVREKGQYGLFSYNFPIKTSEVKDDCSSKDLLIRFEAIEKSSNYNLVNKDDPGIITFEFSRTGSADVFRETYHPTEGKEDLIHR